MSSTVSSNYIFQSPLGKLKATFKGEFLVGLIFTDDVISSEQDTGEKEQFLCNELSAYFLGELKEFKTPIKAKGTPFQEKVWKLLCEIPIGEKCSYKVLSEKFGDPKAIRAIATANGANPISIIIPCHRVIGSDGNLRGYAWGLDKKRSLLELESRHSKSLNLFS